MNKGLSYFVGGILVSVFLGTAAYSMMPKVGRGARVLKLGHGLDTNHPVHKAMEFMNRRLAEISNGRLTLDIYPSGVLGSEVECCEQLQHGILAMTKTSAVTMENFVPTMSVFGLPYMFRDSEHYWKVLNGTIGTELLQQGESKYLRGLCYYDAGSRNFYTKDAPIRTPDDLKGLKIRVMNSQTAMAMVSAMGGSPTPTAWGELYSALAQGTVDGAENNPPSFTSNKHYEVCKHFSFDRHTRIPDMLLISTKIWETLSPEEQGWLQTAATESVDFQRKLWQEKTIEARKIAEAEGVTFYDVDVSLFAAKVAPMIEQVENPDVRALINRISEVK